MIRSKQHTQQHLETDTSVHTSEKLGTNLWVDVESPEGIDGSGELSGIVPKDLLQP